MPIGCVGFVADMAKQLHFGGQAGERPSGNLSSPGKPCRRIAPGAAVLQDLHTTAAFVEGHGVEINAMVASGNDQSGRELVLTDAIPD